VNNLKLSCMFKNPCLYILLIVYVLFPVLCCSEPARGEHVLEGPTMGTYYQVILADVTLSRAKTAQNKIIAVLDIINQKMSVFDPLSEVSRFNRIQPQTKFCPSPEFYEVMQVSYKVYEMTGGAFDPSLGSVIDLWGFGNVKTGTELPGQSEILDAIQGVGLDKIFMDEQGCLIKSHPDTKLNLSAIAKGYGVDAIAGVLEEMGISSYLVDIGGDIYAGKARPDGSMWKVGIGSPYPLAGTENLMQILEIEHEAVATSGHYHNFLVKNGQKYSHIIDSVTGQPARQRTLSATVKAGTCVMADALATAMLVMDTDQSLKLAQESKLFEVLLMGMNGKNKISVHTSPGFYSRGD
jgi:FAD:protein FMN transferase